MREAGQDPESDLNRDGSIAEQGHPDGIPLSPLMMFANALKHDRGLRLVRNRDNILLGDPGIVKETPDDGGIDLLA